jgi:hypothetical protein
MGRALVPALPSRQSHANEVTKMTPKEALTEACWEVTRKTNDEMHEPMPWHPANLAAAILDALPQGWYLVLVDPDDAE